MTQAQQIKGIIYGSFLAYFLDTMLDKEYISKGSIIKAKQLLHSVLRNSKFIEYKELSNDCWGDLIDKHKDQKVKVNIFDFIEAVVFENMEIFEELYGKQFIDSISSFVIKFNEAPGKEITIQTRDLVDDLIEITNKRVYHYLKGEQA